MAQLYRVPDYLSREIYFFSKVRLPHQLTSLDLDLGLDLGVVLGVAFGLAGCFFAGNLGLDLGASLAAGVSAGATFAGAGSISASNSFWITVAEAT